MARRPLAFGARFHSNGRSVRVRTQERDPRRWVVEVERSGRPTRRREHASLSSALADFAATWRARHH